MSKMILKCLDNYEIDPETCSIEELERIHTLAKREEDYWNTMQLSAKTFINSVYGVFGTEYFNLANIDIAESITLQGQDLIKYSVRKINEYFKDQWHKDFEGHKRVSDIMINEYGFKDFDRERFEELAKKPLEFETLQIYGDTDSISGSSVIITMRHPYGIKISDFYDENIENKGEKTLVGHESVHTDDMVYNIDNNDELVFDNVRRIIRHKVSKSKWELVTESNKFVECTGDHSLIVNRYGKNLAVKPSDVNEYDKVYVLSGENSYKKERILSCHENGSYDDEYVYDIEIDGDSHSFIANDILVHNSAYVTMENLINLYDIPKDQQIKFCLAMYKAIMEDFLENVFDDYAESFHCKQNLEKFELEKISRSVIMLAKKNYMCDVAWVDSGIFYEPGHHITYTGFDVVKGSTTNFCRDEMKKFTAFCFDKLNKGSVPTQGECVQFLRECKRRFAMQSPNEIGKTVSISEYEKFVKSDNKAEIEYFDYSNDADGSSKKLSVPIHVRAASVYNNMLLNKKREYLSKYELLKTGDKVRFYYTSPDEVFGFPPDKYPYEFAPKADIDVQFEKSLLSPLNRIIVALGLDEVPPSLTYSVGLF